MSDVITICLNFEVSEVRLIGAENFRIYGAGRKFEFLNLFALFRLEMTEGGELQWQNAPSGYWEWKSENSINFMDIFNLWNGG